MPVGHLEKPPAQCVAHLPGAVDHRGAQRAVRGGHQHHPELRVGRVFRSALPGNDILCYELLKDDLKEEIEVIFYTSPLDAAKKALGVD